MVYSDMVLKENYKSYVNFVLCFNKNKQYCTTISNYPTPHKVILAISRKERLARWPLYPNCKQSLTKAIIQK